MNHSEAVSLFKQMLPATKAIEVLQALDASRVELVGIEGFLRQADGKFESRLDLIVDFSGMRQFTTAEHIEIARMFVNNRATEQTWFELWSA